MAAPLDKGIYPLLIKMYSAKSVLIFDSGYNVFGLVLDSLDRCWIHDGQTNQIIGLNKDLKEKTVFDGISFNRSFL